MDLPYNLLNANGKVFLLSTPDTSAQSSKPGSQKVKNVEFWTAWFQYLGTLPQEQSHVGVQQRSLCNIMHYVGHISWSF